MRVKKSHRDGHVKVASFYYAKIALISMRRVGRDVEVMVPVQMVVSVRLEKSKIITHFSSGEIIQYSLMPHFEWGGKVCQ